MAARGSGALVAPTIASSALNDHGIHFLETTG